MAVSSIGPRCSQQTIVYRKGDTAGRSTRKKQKIKEKYTWLERYAARKMKKAAIRNLSLGLRKNSAERSDSGSERRKGNVKWVSGVIAGCIRAVVNLRSRNV
jgi:hypothetical protein